MRPRVLLVDDDDSYRDALEAGLRQEGFDVAPASDGTSALALVESSRPDVVLLDVLLPDMAGTEVCRRIRMLTDVPVIMVSALDSEVDVVLSLELGASDFVTKPYKLRELVARIQAVLRRSGTLPSLTHTPVAGRSDEVVVAGSIRIDPSRREVQVSGRIVHLSRREFDLLALLVSPPGQVRTRDELIDQLWAGRDLSDTRTLDTHIRRLRAKIERDPARPEHLVTVRGVGFRFDRY